MEYQNPNHNYPNGSRESGEWMDPDQKKRKVRETRKCFSRIGIVYVIFLILANGCPFLVSMVLFGTGLSEKMDDNLYMFLGLLSMYPLSVPLTALFMRWVPAVGQTGNESWGIGKLAGFFVFSMGVLYVGNFVGNILMAVGGVIKGEPIINDVQELITSLEIWTVLLAAVIIAPIMEELVFRKFLLDRIAGYGDWTAMVVSGMLFGIAHGNFYQFFYAFGLGMIFAYIYLHTGRIIYTIGFHILINFLGSIVPLGLLKVVENNGIVGGLLAIGNVMLMFGFIICAAVLMICCFRDIPFYPGRGEAVPEKKAGAVWLNGGMILFLLLGIGTFILAL